MGHPLRVLKEPGSADLGGWESQSEELLELLTKQQGMAQAGLLTAGLAHDVGNYVQHMSGAAFLAMKSSDPEEWRSALATIQERCGDLADITRAFTNLLKRRDVTAVARFPLSQVVDQVGRLIRPLARERSVTIDTLVLTDGEVEGEVRLAIQAVLNLATNAVRACAAGAGRVELQVRRESRELGRIKVSDNGPGIPEDVRRSLFRPLARTGSREDGHGLGLFVVRHAVRRLRGRIRLFTSEDGTTFSLDIPLVS